MNSQKPWAVHHRIGEVAEKPRDVLKRATRWSCCCFPGPSTATRPAAAGISAVKSAVQVRSDCLTQTLLDWHWILANDGGFLTRKAFGEGLSERRVFVATFAWVSPEGRRRNGWILNQQPVSPEPSVAVSPPAARLLLVILYRPNLSQMGLSIQRAGQQLHHGAGSHW